jgi:predicted NACHT family NTPase
MTTSGEGFTIPVFSWIDGPIKKSFQSVFEGLNTSTEALDIFNKFRRNHFKCLLPKVETIKILGMSEPIPLLDIYSPLFVSTTIHSRLYETNWQNLNESTRPTLSVSPEINKTEDCADKYIESHDRVVMLGSAGSGKTTLLKYLALAYSNKTLFKETQLKSSKLPIYVSLLAYSDKANSLPDLFSYIANELKQVTNDFAENYIRRLLTKGLSIVLLDSLDEVPDKLRETVTKRVKEFASQFPSCKIVLTCRTADYSENLENFCEVEISKLTPGAIEKIIRGWFKNEPAKADLLIKHLKAQKDVRNLCQTPLLLSLLCIQFRHDLSLPKRKIELYRRCIEAFLRDWDASRGFRRESAYSSLSDDRKEKIFECLAGGYADGDSLQITFPEKETVKCLANCCGKFGIKKTEARNVLSEIEQHHGIIERFSRESFSFSHPSFHEFFAARYFVAKRVEFEKVKAHIDSTQWSNIIEFIVALHHDPTNIIEYLIKQSSMKGLRNFPAMAVRTRRLCLLYRCLSVGPFIEDKVKNKALEHVLSSQFDMATVFKNGNTYPIASLVADGVRHAYFYVDRPRNTLKDALLPYRQLSNEILVSPSQKYADIVCATLKQMNFFEDKIKTPVEYAFALCLAIPISSVRSEIVLQLLNKIIASEKAKYIGQIADQSRRVLASSKFAKYVQ